MINGLARKIELYLSRFIGLQNEEIKPMSVNVISNKLIISSNCSYKRHVIRESWKDFAIKNVEIHEKEKLGLAVGKALAKNLIINFEHTELEKEV